MKIFLILLLCCLPSFAEAANPRDAVVRVYNNESDGARSSGSGVLVTRTQVVTNFHVIKGRKPGSKALQIRFTDGTRSWAKVERYDTSWDLALLSIKPHPTFQPLRMGKMPEVGDVLTIHGFGNDYEYKTQSGKMSSTFFGPTEASGPGWFEIKDVVARQGDSGGPITNTKGEWIGTLFGSTDNIEYGRSTTGAHIRRIKLVFGRYLKVFHIYDDIYKVED